MIERVLDNPWLRIAIGAVVGVPLTAAALVGFLYGVVFFVGGLAKGNLVLVSLGLVAALGMLGVAGAWRRLLKRHTAMSHRERIVVRFLLLSGVASSVVLAGASVVSAESAVAALFFALLTAGGVALVVATPIAL